jgi:hypothetical protein
MFVSANAAVGATSENPRTIAAIAAFLVLETPTWCYECGGDPEKRNAIAARIVAITV